MFSVTLLRNKIGNKLTPYLVTSVSFPLIMSGLKRVTNYSSKRFKHEQLTYFKIDPIAMIFLW